MTATFILADGQTVQASNAAELVAQMHQASRTEAVDDKSYMMDVAERTALQSGHAIRTSSHEAFVNDLLKYDLIKVVPAGSPPSPSLIDTGKVEPKS